MICKHCGAPESYLTCVGISYNVSGNKQRWKCKNPKCKRISVVGTPRYPPKKPTKRRSKP